jgi:hypothetical protein
VRSAVQLQQELNRSSFTSVKAMKKCGKKLDLSEADYTFPITHTPLRACIDRDGISVVPGLDPGHLDTRKSVLMR